MQLATKPAPFKANAAQAAILKQLAAIGAPTTDYSLIIREGGNGKTISRLAELGLVKITEKSKKVIDKTYALTAAGKKAAVKLA
jgi:hypothetical protein